MTPIIRIRSNKQIERECLKNSMILWMADSYSNNVSRAIGEYAQKTLRH
jgi:hypothetical protein